MLRSESSSCLIPGVCMLCTFLYTSSFNKKKRHPSVGFRCQQIDTFFYFSKIKLITIKNDREYTQLIIGIIP